ncbi:hypothetical protein SDC9_88078 [bioreactor metagenome]|uniref:Uncharacterized protein n=1 Tax=bioreactor metagenome TaxID=1076179 RepID=A0A644ZRZ3_9ZZZZ
MDGVQRLVVAVPQVQVFDGEDRVHGFTSLSGSGRRGGLQNVRLVWSASDLRRAAIFRRRANKSAGSSQFFQSSAREAGGQIDHQRQQHQNRGNGKGHRRLTPLVRIDIKGHGQRGGG